MADSSLGWAWVWLRLRSAGIVKREPLREEYVRSLLRAALERPEGAGAISLFIGEGGPPVVAAMAVREGLVAHGVFSSLMARLARTTIDCRRTDIMGGTAGALMACAEIEEQIHGAVPDEFIAALHARTLSGLEELVARARREPVPLGMSHGAAGQLLALETAGVRLGLPFPARLRAASLDLLSREGRQLSGDGALWPHFSGAMEMG